jgi:two-component system sensor histidine kinase CssS
MIFLIVLVPLVTLLFFNIALQIYLQKEARSELREAMLPIETMAQQELQDSAGTLTESSLESVAIKLTNTVQSPNLTGARLLIYDGKGNLAYPQNLPYGFVSENLAQQIGSRLSKPDFVERVAQINTRNVSYLMTGYVLNGTANSHITIVLVCQEGFAGALIKIVNIILFIIMLLGIVFGILIANRISGRISTRVGQICIATERIGQGDFTQPEWEETDISEFHQLFLSFSKMSERLEGSERSQRDFFQNASHELRTPLMSIQGYALGIMKGIVPSTTEAADIIHSESCRLTTLVEELLTLSRIESRTFSRALVVLNLRELIPEFVQRLGGIAVKQEKTLQLNLSADSVFVLGDEDLLGQAVTNIVSNCLRYAKETVEITLLEQENSALIRIQDDGSGMHEEDISHLFERFYKGKDGNFGLGLAIAKSAVEYIGGSVSAYNTDNGAVFEISLNRSIKG